MTIDQPHYITATQFVCGSANFADRQRTSFQTNSSPIHLFFRCFDPNTVPPRSLPTVPEHRKLVGPLTIELPQKMPSFIGVSLIR